MYSVYCGTSNIGPYELRNNLPTKDALPSNILIAVQFKEKITTSNRGQNNLFLVHVYFYNNNMFVPWCMYTLIIHYINFLKM